MNIIKIADADIPTDIIERLKPIARACIQNQKLHNIPDVEQFFLDMSKEGVGDAAIIVAAHVATGGDGHGVAYGTAAVRPLRDWAEQYRPELLET
jgi:hypothetical protein